MPPSFFASLRLAASVIAMSASMAACGGGSEQPSAPPSPALPQAPSSTAPPSAGTAPEKETVPTTSSQMPLQLLVPAYFYPSTQDSQWDVLSAGATAYPDVKITAILNPNNGIFTKADPAFTAAIQTFENRGGKVIGYVSTKYGARDIQEVEKNIANYLSFYPSVQGVFLDEMGSQDAKLHTYQSLASYICGKSSTLQIVGNPGTPPTSGYAAVADTLVTFEGKEVDYYQLDPQSKLPWIYSLPASANAALIHNAASCEQMQAILRKAKTSSAHTGLIYVTDRQYDYQKNLGDPWATLPSYWMQMLASVDALNQQKPLPPCSTSP